MVAKKPECHDCLAEGVQRWRPVEGVRVKRCATHRRAKKVAQKSRNRDRRVLTTYGMTPEQWEALNAFQGGLCAICGPWTGNRGASRSLSTDHDHSCCAGPTSCGKCVRGLLCGTCNTFIGRIRDNFEVAQSMASYLQYPPTQQLRDGMDSYRRIK